MPELLSSSYEWPLWLEDALVLCRHEHSDREISKILRERLGKSGPSQPTVSKWLARWQAEASSDDGVITPVSRGKSRNVALLMYQGTTAVDMGSATFGLFPQVSGVITDSDGDLYLGTDEGHTCRCWVMVRHPQTKRTMMWMEQATHITALLKCPICQHTIRPRQVTQYEANTEQYYPPRYVVTEVRHLRSMTQNARRQTPRIPLFIRTTQTSRGTLWAVYAGDEVTSRRNRDRANMKTASLQETAAILDNGLSHTDDIKHLQAVRQYKVPQLHYEAKRERRESQGYERITCASSIDPLRIVRNATKRDVVEREWHYTDDETWALLQRETQRGKR